MNIKKVSETLGLTIDTIRYYERIGIIPPVQRDKNGYRDYQTKDLNWLFIAKHLRNAGLSIESLVDFTQLEQTDADTTDAKKAILQEQLDKLNEKLAEIEKTRDLLKYKLDTYDERLANFNSEQAETEKLWITHSIDVESNN